MLRLTWSGKVCAFRSAPLALGATGVALALLMSCVTGGLGASEADTEKDQSSARLSGWVCLSPSADAEFALTWDSELAARIKSERCESPQANARVIIWSSREELLGEAASDRSGRVSLEILVPTDGKVRFLVESESGSYSPIEVLEWDWYLEKGSERGQPRFAVAAFGRGLQ